MFTSQEMFQSLYYQIETIIFLGANFNSNNDENNFDSCSDNKEPESEGVATGVMDERSYAFVGLERIGGAMVYDITKPDAPVFVRYLSNRDFSADLQRNQRHCEYVGCERITNRIFH